MSFLAVANWERYQHYKDRQPIWVKLYVEQLHSKKLKALPLSTRLLWTQMLLLAAQFQNAVPNSPELIGNLAGIPPEECAEGIALLLQGRWLREKQTRRSASSFVPQKKEVRDKKDAGARAQGGAPRLRLAPCAYCGTGGGQHAADCSALEEVELGGFGI